MRVIDINGRLATAGSWDETSQSEADAQARLRSTRTGLRAMLAGNEAFHVDPMAAPMVFDPITETRSDGVTRQQAEEQAEVWHTEAPTVRGVYIACVCGSGKDLRRHWDGVSWSNYWRVGAEEDDIAAKRARRLDSAMVIPWLRLIEADTPAPAALKVGDRVMTTFDGPATVMSLHSGDAGTVFQNLATVKLDSGYEGCTSADGLKRIGAPAAQECACLS